MRSSALAAKTTGRVVMETSFGYAPFYRYWNGVEHFYTVNINEIGTAVQGEEGKFSYRSEGVQCIVCTRPEKGTVPLYRYWNGKDHFYTTNCHEIGVISAGVTGKFGYTFESIAAYCYIDKKENTVPLYRYWNGVDHFYTTDPEEIGTVVAGEVGKSSHKSEGVACYVLPYAL